jgi:hypothetical protein
VVVAWSEVGEVVVELEVRVQRLDQRRPAGDRFAALDIIAPRRQRHFGIELLVVDVAVVEGLDAVAFTDAIFSTCRSRS